MSLFARIYGLTLIYLGFIGTLTLFYFLPSNISNLLTSFSSLTGQIQLSPPTPALPLVSSSALFTKLNQYRTSQNLASFILDPNLCQSLGQFDRTASPSSNLFSRCPTCSQANIIQLNRQSTTNQILAQLISHPPTATTLNNPIFTHLCLSQSDLSLNLIFLVLYSPSTTISQFYPSPPPSPKEYPSISTQQLWQALTIYRQAHQVPELRQDPLLCLYAHKRLQDHLDKLAQNLPPDQYPDPDKYPLDAHHGFMADASSGYAFQTTQKNELAENLAYWPQAQSATQIIEWGWDSSTEGHRETQLSTRWTDVCLVSDQGIIVAIFGH